MDLLVKLLVAGSSLTLIDLVWIKFVATGMYKAHLSQWLLEKPNLVAALSFYALYTVGAVFLVVNPALEKNSLAHAVGYGALLGLVAYGTFALTNAAAFKDFAWKLVIADMLWGAVLTAIVSGLTFWVVKTWLS